MSKQPESRIAGLKQGGAPHRGKGGKFYLGIAYRNAFTKEDMVQLANTLKLIAHDKNEKTADRLKAIDIIIKKIISDAEPEIEEMTIKNADEFKRALASLTQAASGLSEISSD